MYIFLSTVIARKLLFEPPLIACITSEVHLAQKVTHNCGGKNDQYLPHTTSQGEATKARRDLNGISQSHLIPDNAPRPLPTELPHKLQPCALVREEPTVDIVGYKKAAWKEVGTRRIGGRCCVYMGQVPHPRQSILHP